MDGLLLSPVLLDEPVGPIHHGRLAVVTGVGSVPRPTCHEGVSIAVNDVADEIIMPIIPGFLSIRRLVQRVSGEELYPAESQRNCSVEANLHEVLLRLDH